MKRYLLIITTALLTGFTHGQQQLQNGDFESWEAVPGGSEPVNWNSFLTAGGGLASLAANQIEVSADVRPGSSGVKSVKIWSRVPFPTLIANGNLTLGKINMGSSQATNADNYNRTITTDPAFNQVMQDKPDSIVFWTKFTPNGHSGKARMKATIHDNYDYRDPEDAASMLHIVGTAVDNFPSTNGQWVRKSIPFEYNGPATDAAYVLLTFTTSEVAGGGKKDDFLWIDDVEFIYNELSVDKNQLLNTVSIYPNPVKEVLTISNVQKATNYTIHSVLGEVIMKGELNDFTNKIETNKIQKGVYFLHLTHGEHKRTIRFIKN